MAVHWLARLALINQAYLRRHAQQIKQEDIARAHAKSETVTAQLRSERLLKSVAREAGELIALLRDYWRGRYTHTPKRVIGAVAFTVLYIANPFDLIPDYIVGIGFLDDVAVVNVAYLLMRKDLEAYRIWRRGQTSDASPTLSRTDTLNLQPVLALPPPEAVSNAIEKESGTLSRNQPTYR